MKKVDDDKALGIKVMKLSRLLRLRFDQRAQGLGLTRAQWQTIACVRRRPGATQREIAALLEVGEVTVGRSIDKLVEAGWVERRPDPADRRAHRIWLTAALPRPSRRAFTRCSTASSPIWAMMRRRRAAIAIEAGRAAGIAAGYFSLSASVLVRVVTSLPSTMLSVSAGMRMAWPLTIASTAPEA